MSFEGLWEAITALFGPQAQLHVTTSLEDFSRSLINSRVPDQRPLIRMYVAGAQGFGHQASTVNIMRQLVAPAGEPTHGFAFIGDVEMYYEPGTDKDKTKTYDKLQQLIPELHGGETCTIGFADITLIPWVGGVVPTTRVEFGFCGGLDREGLTQLPNLCDRLNTRSFLVLQPFLWEAPEELQFISAGPFPGLRVDLRAQPTLGTTSFLQRAYFMPHPDEPDWADDYPKGSTYYEASYIIDYLTHPEVGIDLGPVYGIRSDNLLQLRPPAFERMFQVIAAALASQRNEKNKVEQNARPIVLLSCSDFGTSDEQLKLQAALDGGWSEHESACEEAVEKENLWGDEDSTTPDKAYKQWEAVLRGARARVRWLKAVKAHENVRFVWAPAKVEAVEEAVEWAKEGLGRVVVVQLGRVPPPLFTWAMAQSKWPPVFEGPNTANTALNLGVPYFHVAREDFHGVQYPTDVVGYGPPDDWNQYPAGYAAPTPRRIQEAANQIGADLTLWGEMKKYPPAIAGDLVRALRDEPSSSPLHRYFRKVRDFYAIPANDKLRLAAAFYQYVLEGGDHPAAVGIEAAASVLDPVYHDLLDSLTKLKVLTIVPGAHAEDGAFTEGGVHDFYRALFPETGLVLTGAEVVPHYEDDVLVEIEATGRTEFLGVQLAAHVSFTAPRGVVMTEGRYTADERWTVGQIPWIALDRPFIEFTVADSGAPLAGAVGGTVASAGVELSFRLPAAEGVWQLVGEFEEPQSIASFYQLAGGVDLLRALPEPFASLSGFGLKHVELVYDENEDGGQISYIGFRMTTAAPIPLLGSLTLRDIIANVTVLLPGSTAERETDWDVRGTFAVGAEGPDQPVVQLSATGLGTVLTGNLIQGVLSAGEIIALFAPDVDLGIPDTTAVTQFMAQFALVGTDYSVTCALSAGWDVVVNRQTVFTIESLEFTASGQDTWSLGSLSGYVTIDPEGMAFPLILTGVYTRGDWQFGVLEPPGATFPVNTLINQFLPRGWALSTDDYKIADLALNVAYNEGSWDFAGRTDGFWTVPFIDDLKASAELALGYQGAGSDKPEGYSLRVSAEILWHGIDLTVYGDYEPTKLEYGVRWGALEGKVLQRTVDGVPGPYTATLKFADDTTIGSMIETMVSWATGSRFALESPWSVLNAIPVGGLALEYVFDSKVKANNRVSFRADIGPIDLGFARIDSVAVVYDDHAEHKVAITLRGSFPWNFGDGSVGDEGALGPWDASAPGAAPAPPGAGNEYLDLRLLALGQHIRDAELAEARDVQDAIKIMGRLPDTEPGQIPVELGFSADSAWIIGADLGILRFGGDSGSGDDESGYLLTVQSVFNDPVLYALRLALAGPAAKVFSGLDFQIMYRQVSATVGVYQAELVLPDEMRRLGIGAYTVTLPTTAVAVYTNGDFQVDVGFPWNGDFTRSFTVEGVIVPGIPVVGSAGFYFGRLSSTTTDRVPQVLNGTFSPVIVFGLGMTFGFGKSVQSGPLKAGFSVTASGIVEGVLATFNPYLPATTPGDVAQVQDGYYFWLRGAVAVSGRLYGSVDFSVVKADVDASFSLLLQLTYESYVSTSVTVIVSVDVSATISIDLGMFSIKLSFSFSLRLRETFTLENGGTPPWTVAGPDPESHSLSGPAGRRNLYRRALSPGAVSAAAEENRWGRLQKSKYGVKTLKAWLAPGLTVAHNENDAPGSFREQVACWVVLPLIESVPAADGTLNEVLVGSAAADDDSSFERLAKMVLRWAISAVQAGDVTPEDLDDRTVTEADLAYLLSSVLVSREGDQLPIAPSDVDAFMTRQFRCELRQPPTGTSTSDATSFPMPTGVRMSSKGWGSAYPPFGYTFDGYNELSDTTVQNLREHFDQLAVQVSDQPGPAATRESGGTLSMAQWVQSDYFLLLARQMTQAALDSLRDFKYVIGSQTAAVDIVADVNQTGGLTGGDQLSVGGLFAANSGRALTGGNVLTIAGGAVVGPDESFDKLADRLGPTVTATALAQTNAGDTLLLRIDAAVFYRGVKHTVKTGESLLSIAGSVFKTRFSDFLSGADGLFADPLLLIGGRTVVVPQVTVTAREASTFDSLATDPAYKSGGVTGMSGAQLAKQNAARPILRSGETISYGGLPPYVVQPDDCLADVALAIGVDVSLLIDKGPVTAQHRLIADGAVLVLPAVGVKIATGDTLASLASRTGTTTGTLATWPGNGAVKGLFAAGTPGTAASWVDVPHLAQYRVGSIIDEIQRTLGIHQLSRMAGRYSMHGTRLPTAGIVPKAKGIWVTGEPGSLKLPPTAGLFALTGQQVVVPYLGGNPGQSYVVTLEPPAAGSPSAWAVFPENSTAFVLDDKNTDTQRIIGALSAVKLPFDMPLTSLGAGKMTSSSPASYPLTTVTPWVSPTPVTLPYPGTPPKADQVQQLRIRALPDALIGLPDPRTPGKSAPRFAVRLSAYDESTGATTTADVASHGWATVVSFTVRRVPQLAASAATADTYEILGAGGADVVLLERIVGQIGADETEFAALVPAFAADTAAAGGSAGLQTDHQPGVTFGIAQANLSTETRPPTPALGAEATPRDGALMLNEKPEFVRLLWEASITRAGGFFFYYYDSTNSRGLPDRLFNDRGEAQVSLIVMYAAGKTASASDRVCDYMTAVVTGTGVDTAQAVVVAEAAPMEQPVPTSLGLSLAQLAERTYSDVGDLAADNATLKLAGTASLVIDGGVYQAPPEGIGLQQVATDYGTTVDDLNTANPQWDGAIQDPLPGLTAIFLPRMTVPCDSAHTATFAAAVKHYGIDITALAHENAAQAGIFDSASVDPIKIPGGPMVRSATVVPGAAAIAASRPKPLPVPLDPSTNPSYGKLLLQNNFSLLQYEVAGNRFYGASFAGLPAGPTPGNAPTAAPNYDKVRVAADSTVWDYRQAIPASRFSTATPIAVNGLPDPAASPYLGMGSILQVKYSWLDFYGNTLITTLDTLEPGPATQHNLPPQVTGYTDVLIGLSAWPSVAASWRVAGTSGAARLEVPLAFDASPYQGLYRAEADGAGATVTALFTDPLDRQSPQSPGNYRIVRVDDTGAGETIPIAAAALTGGSTVVLTLGRQLTAKHEYVLSIGGVLGVAAPGASQPTYSGSATFPSAGSGAAHTSSTIEHAKHDLGVYRSLYYQLIDPAGVSATLTSSLLTEPIAVAGAEWDEVLAWLFVDRHSIYAFLADRAVGGTDAEVPRSPHTIVVPLSEHTFTTEQIYRLTLSFTLRRNSAAVLGELRTTPAIRTSSTDITPATHAAAGQDSLGLATFARDLEAALSVDDSYLIKVAGGVDRAVASPARDGATLWAVRIGIAAGQPIGYRVADTGNPEVFAPRPASNTLISRPGVPIWDYSPESGITFTANPSRKLDFADVDLDVWLRGLLDAVDDTLSPMFAAALQIVNAELTGTDNDYLARILRSKKTLADWLSTLMIPVYADTVLPTENLADIREAYRQQLLDRLSHAYGVRAGIQFRADVHADVRDPLATVPPRLFGPVSDVVTQGEASSEVTLSSPKLSLRTAAGVPLPILVSAPNAVSRDGAVVGSVELDLAWRPSSIEHQIAQPAGIEGYLASSWLSFVVPDEPRGLLAGGLGKVAVPLVLRTFPAGPAMTGQTGTAADESATDLAGLRKWTYSFTWSLPFHYEQDRVHGRVEFNLSGVAAPAQAPDLFDQLAEFTMVYPQVRADMDEVLAAVDATTAEPTPKHEATLKNADIAARSFCQLLERITQATGDPESALVFRSAAPALAGDDDLAYIFDVSEGHADLPDPREPGRTVRALLVTLHGVLPAGIGTPKVLIEPKRYRAEPHPVTGPDALGFCYFDTQAGTYLTEADGQKIPARTMVLPDLDVFERQDAWAGAWTSRNEELVEGRATAKPFVYTTPEARFADPMLPTLDSGLPVDIGTLGAPIGPRSLEAQFTALFAEILAGLPEPGGPLTVQAEIGYGYRLAPGLDPITLPIFFQAPKPVELATRGAGSPLDVMIGGWSEAIRPWFQADPPSGADGTLHCDLAILSNLTVTPMPLFRLRNTYVRLADIDPPLRTLRAGGLP